jgi:drug/metabolite transporter (DMT)-like permease
MHAQWSLVLRTAFALSAFAGNSLLCRWALKTTTLDAASFTTLRLVSGAVFLWWLVRQRAGAPAAKPNWVSGAALWVYAAAFSFAYLGLTVATGALILFGAVQVTMTSYGLLRGERLQPRQWAGMALALAGLTALLLPGLAAPPLAQAALMLLAGVAWGVYSLRGKQSAGNPLQATASNFMLAAIPALGLSVLTWPQANWDVQGALYACASGMLASGAGYAVWYSVLPRISPASAATLQLSVPVIAALGGLLLGESVTVRLLLCSAVVLGGVALATVWSARR